MIHRTEPFQNILALIVICTDLAFFFWISYSDKATNNQHIGEIKTALIAATMLVLNYYFGSSRDSQRKGEVINQLLKPQDGSTTVTSTSPDPAKDEPKKDEPKTDDTIK